MQIEWDKSVFEPIQFAGRRYIIKRDDMLLPIGGNKARKLAYLAGQDLSPLTKIVSHGGAQSNAMLALAQFCKIQSLGFDYYTRPVPNWLKANPIGNLQQAIQHGMNWYTCASGLPPEFSDNRLLLIPQGISMPEAEFGMKKLADEIHDYCLQQKLVEVAVVLPSGTGATALYLQQHLRHTVYTVPCIGNSKTLMQFFRQQLPNAKRYPSIIDANQTKNLRFGEPHPLLLSIYEELLDATGIEFELLYDAKTWLSMLDWHCHKTIIYIHNGGTSGNLSMLSRYHRLGMLDNEPFDSV